MIVNYSLLINVIVLFMTQHFQRNFSTVCKANISFLKDYFFCNNNKKMPKLRFFILNLYSEITTLKTAIHNHRGDYRYILVTEILFIFNINRYQGNLYNMHALHKS